MDFPVYRKYINERSYFKIDSPMLFEELRITGKYFSIDSIETKTLPERNFIGDMLNIYEHHWIAIEEFEYIEKKEYCLQYLTRVAF